MAPADYIGFTEAAKLLPGKISRYSLHAWCRAGLPGPDGKRIYLQCVQVGRKLFTTKAWLEEFITIVAEASKQRFEQRQKSHMQISINVPSHDEAMASFGVKQRASIA